MKKLTAFTLLETLVVLALFSMLFALVFNILMPGRTAWDIGSTKQDLQNQLRRAIEDMLEELCQSNFARVTISNGSSCTNCVITFQVPIGYEASGSGMLNWGAEANTDYWIRYTVNGNQLLREIREIKTGFDNLVSTRVLGNYVRDLTFSLSGSRLTVNLTLQKTTSAGQVLSENLSSGVSFRN